MISVKECKSYSSAYSRIKEAVNLLGGFGRFIRKGDKVLLKINQLQAKKKESAVTTDPAFVEAAIRLVKEAGALPYVGDSPAIQPLPKVAEESGIAEVCRNNNTTLAELDSPERISIPKGKRVRSLEISGKLKEFDAIINLPKLKTHMLIGMTCAVKNLYGCIPGRLKAGYHLNFQRRDDFAEMLLDLNLAVKPALTIVDAVVGMEGQGPGAGNPKKIGYIIAGTATVEVDSIAADIIGLKNVATIDAARRRGMKGAKAEKIKVLGDRYSQVQSFKEAHSPKIHAPRLSALVAKPVLDEKRCIRCGNCARACPNEAIKMTKGGPKFDYSRCIRCYCCHEVCPARAIYLKHNLLSALVSRIMR